MRDNYIPVCKFCGQAHIPPVEFETEEAAVEWATMNCLCDEGETYRLVERSKKEAEDMLGEYDDKVKACIGRSIADVGFRVLDKVSMSFNGRHTVKLTRKTDGTVVMELKETTSEKIEL